MSFSGHHGQLEYGSPVRPRIMEAEIIHMIDNLDASMMMMTTALNLVGPGEMTNRLFAMDNSFLLQAKNLIKIEIKRAFYMKMFVFAVLWYNS